MIEKKKELNSAISELLKQLREEKADLTPEEIMDAIRELTRAHREAVKHEEEIARMREEEERLELERRNKEEMDARVEKATCMDLPLDWENVFDSDARTQGVHVDNASDALILSQVTLGRVDIEYMASITGKDYKEVIESLRGAIYQNPEKWEECFYKGWETADEYLTGNLMRKWNAANEANKIFRGHFTENLRAIEKVIPETVATKDIYVTIGSPWVPADVIDDFIEYLLGPSSYSKLPAGKVKHDEITGTWDIPFKSRYYDKSASYSTYGTSRMEALYIIEKTLNMKNVAVTDKVPCNTNKSGEKRILNKAETALAIEKQKLIIEKFQKWIWMDSRRKERLEEIFESRFSCVRTRRFDGSFLTFPTMNPEVELYPYQKNAIARILFSKNTLLAHDVGSGKTYVMVAAAMELLRMGLSKKNLFVVPNNIVGQWRNIFQKLYPQANLLCVEPKNFTPTKRIAVLEDIRDNSYDGIIMAYSCFDMIKLSNKYYLESLKEEKKELEEMAKTYGKRTSGLERRQKKVKEEIDKIYTGLRTGKLPLAFDELGITRLFVDEAHNYKNVPMETQVEHVLGINSEGSGKGKSMMEKVCYIQKQNDGGGVVMATGTPITNSITDAFIMQKYLQSGELAALDLQSFDAWIGMFAERSSEFEIDVDTNSYRLATRFSKFHNLPELTSLLSSIADFHQMRSGGDLPEFDGYNDALIGRTMEFAKYLDEISHRADAVRRGQVRRKDDNMLKITTDGRKAALDLRLVDPTACFTYQSKVARCAENVADIYHKTAANRSTQLIFCDSSTPKAGFNLYDEMTRLLLTYGVREEEIAYIHDADTDRKREVLFDKMQRGEVRVLLGSTFKLGLGVNVQRKLIAVHHLDVPWRPADMVQREGRILRQGNENEKVQIFRYITEGSFDAYSWQLLETKQNFISALLSGSITERSGSDVDDVVLNYAEVKALAIGNPLIKKRVETVNELNRHLALQRKLVEEKELLEKRYSEMPFRIAEARTRMNQCRADILRYVQNKREYDAEERKELRAKIYEAVLDNVLEPAERPLMQYQGFDVILPANMLAEKPYVWLQGDGKYYVELGDTERGMIIRIDNFLEELKNLVLKYTDNLADLSLERERIRMELEKDESYVDKIEELKAEIKRIDKELGVTEK
ncbi:MAG: DEAD/DEAH box helicase family protein [Clostridia bacterium]|nr:DEAD/DEAH box helicase family protein [Clostridia bacterium]